MKQFNLEIVIVVVVVILLIILEFMFFSEFKCCIVVIFIFQVIDYLRENKDSCERYYRLYFKYNKF